jgi:hypothetical protein
LDQRESLRKLHNDEISSACSVNWEKHNSYRVLMGRLEGKKPQEGASSYGHSNEQSGSKLKNFSSMKSVMFPHLNISPLHHADIINNEFRGTKESSVVLKLQTHRPKSHAE